MTSLSLAFDILARDRGASKTLDHVAKSADNAGKSAAGFGTMMKGAAGIAAGALAAAGIGSLISDSIGEARESQKVGAVTAQIIKATGGAAKLSAAQVGDLAAAISNKTGVDDEAIQTGANLLLTFKNVRNEAGQGANVFDRATTAAVDLSKAGFGSIDGASKMLGKALNDPIKGLSALGKAGVTFTEQQKTQIKTMMKSGDVLGAQKIILGEVEAQVGGVAAASATMDEKLATSAGNLKEKLGTALLPLIDKFGAALVDDVIPALEGMIDELSVFAKWISDNRGPIKGFAIGIGALVAVVGAHTLALGLNSGALKAWLIQSKLVQAATKTWAALQWLLNAALTANPIGIVIALIAALAVGLVLAYQKSETFRKIVTGAWTAVQAGATFMWERVLKPTFKFLVQTWLTVAGAIVSGAVTAFGWVPGIGPKLKDVAAKFETLKSDINRSLGKIDDEPVTVSVGFKFGGPTTAKYALTPQGSVYLTGKGDGYGLDAYGKGIGDGYGIDVKTMFPPMSKVTSTGRNTAMSGGGNALMAMLEDSVTGNPSNARGWKAMWAAVKAVLPGATLNSAFRPGAITATGKRSYHGMGRAVDLGPATMKTFNVVKSLFPNATELIFSPAGNRQLWHGKPHMYSGVTRANHWDHVHLAMQRGGLVPGHGIGDRVPAMLEPGEYVVSRPQVQRQGVAALDAMNGGAMPSGITNIYNGDVYDYSLLERQRRQAVAEQRAASFRAGLSFA